MKIQVVDDQDRVIGVKERAEIDYNTEIYRVSALWITNSKGQTLLAKRAAAKGNQPGKWGPAVAGTVEENETYDDNIYKEAMEEIGLEGTQFAKSIKMRISSPRHFFCQWYTANLDRDADSFTMRTDEVDGLEWVDIAYLQADLLNNPEKYIPTMSRVVAELL